MGQLIGGVLAANQAIAQRAARLVKVEYKDLAAIITIEEAIAENSYFGTTTSIKKGDADATFNSCDHIIMGTTRNGAQEHFYMETMAFVAVPNNEKV